MTVQRYYLDGEEPSELEQLCINATVNALLDAGWTFTDDVRIMTNAAGERRWFSFGFEERPLVEPEVGTVVASYSEGTLRSGEVEHRGPGYFSFRYRYRSGRGGSSQTVMIDRDQYRVVEPSQ